MERLHLEPLALAEQGRPDRSVRCAGVFEDRLDELDGLHAARSQDADVDLEGRKITDEPRASDRVPRGGAGDPGTRHEGADVDVFREPVEIATNLSLGHGQETL